jgi:N-acyl homoserine lactone hydrolase
MLEERPWIVRWGGDLDPAMVRHYIQRLRALKDRFPELIIVPAHDQRGFAEMTQLSSLTHNLLAPPAAQA